MIAEAPLGVPQSDLITVLLILVLGMALGIGLICLLLVLHFLRSGRLAQRRLSKRDGWWSGERKFQSSIFTTPPRWLAVRCGNPLVVQAALGLNRPIPCSWEEGLTAAHEQKLFISPSVNGWVLVFGSALPDPADDVDKCFKFVLEVTRKLGQVQLFSYNRVVSYHSWVQADQGRILRAYAWAGKTVWNQGTPTRAESELGLTCYDYSEPAPRQTFAQSDPVALNTDRVPLLAARWSLDPAAIDSRALRQSHGITGRLSRPSRAH